MQLSLTTVNLEEVYVAAFFKVMQQQTTHEVTNSITYFWADNFCLQQWKNDVVCHVLGIRRRIVVVVRFARLATLLFLDMYIISCLCEHSAQSLYVAASLSVADSRYEVVEYNGLCVSSFPYLRANHPLSITTVKIGQCLQKLCSNEGVHFLLTVYIWH